MNDKNKNFIKCDFCKSSAIVNFQKVWTKFNINKRGKYREDEEFDCFDVEEPMNDDNLHLCKKDFKRWINGEI